MKKIALTLASLLVSSVAMAAPPVVSGSISPPKLHVSIPLESGKIMVNVNPSGNLHLHVISQDPKINFNTNVKNIF
jgi:hypothetical protein